MDTFFEYLKKTLVLSVFVIFAFVATYIPQPVVNSQNVPQAEAALPTIDAGNIIQTTASAISNAFTAAVQYTLQLKELTLDGIAWALAKQVVSQMVASTIEWINSGFSGSGPRFVQDLKVYFDQVAGSVFENFINELGGDGSFLCSPFKIDILLALQFDYNVVGNDRPYQGCTLTGVIDNIESFIDGNFSNGGWDDWFDITMNPQVYTPFGQLQEARQEQDRRIAEAKSNSAQTLSHGSGFLPTKVCSSATSDRDFGTDCKIQLPGRPIADQLAKSLGAGQDTLIAADELSELIGALLNQLSVQAITGTAGLLGLSVDGSSPTGSGNSYIADFYNEKTPTEETPLPPTGFTSTAITEMRTAIQVQRNYQTLASTYRSRFNVPRNDTDLSNTLQDSAQDAYDETQIIIGRTNTNITSLAGPISRYDALESEYAANPDMSPAREREIRAEQQSVIDAFYVERERGDYYTQPEYNASRSAWERLMKNIDSYETN